MRFPLLLIVPLATVLAGCGSNPQATGSEPDLTVSVPAATVSASSSTPSTTDSVSATAAPATVPSGTTERVATVPVDEPCDQDRRLLEVAIEAYFAQTGEEPTAMNDLVDYLREPVDSYSLTPGGELERRTGVPCRTESVTSDEPAAIETVDDALAFLGGDQFVAEVGGIECANEIAVIVLAAQAYTEVNGTEPAELADLDGFLESTITRWVWQPESETVVPAPGSGCVDRFSEDFSEDDGPTRCEIERKTLEVASEAYRAQHDTSPRSQDDLVDGELIREVTPDFTVTDGIVEAVPGSSCDIPGETAVTLPAQPTTTLPQITHTLEVHSDGCGVFRSGDIGDDLTWVVKDLDGFQVLGRNAAGETQYRYFGSGTYTVALEAWGGSYYVTVSNEVTISC